MQTLESLIVILCPGTHISCPHRRFAILGAFWHVLLMQKCQNRRVADGGWHDTRGAVATALRGTNSALETRASPPDTACSRRHSRSAARCCYSSNLRRADWPSWRRSRRVPRAKMVTVTLCSSCGLLAATRQLLSAQVACAETDSKLGAV